MFQIQSERPQDGPAIEQLLDLAFGADRWTRPSYRLRDGVPAVLSLCFTVQADGKVVGAIRFWPVAIDYTTPALLLGPIAVHPDCECQGIGTQLVQKGIQAARQQGHAIIVAIGNLSFLGRFGFRRGGDYGLVLPGAKHDNRFVALALAPGALDGKAGTVTRVREAVA